ncbi:ABC transporter permease subunit [Dehalobacter sp. DCM]|uniref:ABC transporter permease subunit n=1 Tax=Dehalobacter sp. DCM TaxID=2907827 RepID=UPI0030812AC6|nr:ABC transporter permease subunit [Dehalobacter sp. DCM]
MNAMQRAMIYKDIREVTGDKQILMPMLIVPVVMMVILPLILVIGARYGVSAINGMDYMINALGDQFADLTNAQLLFEIALNYMFPVFFLLIPIMSGSIIGASSFVGEKEHKTMESLFYTPISIRELFNAKVVATAVPAIVITLLSAVVFGIVMNIGGWMYFGKIVFPSIKWLILILWVSPAVTILSIYFMVLVSAKAKTFQEAQQTSAFIIIPVILLLVGQMTGLFVLNEAILGGFGAVVFMIDFILMRKAAARFVPEKLI